MKIVMTSSNSFGSLFVDDVSVVVFCHHQQIGIVVQGVYFGRFFAAAAVGAIFFAC